MLEPNRESRTLGGRHALHFGGGDDAGKIPGDFEAEVKQALNNIGAVFKAAGLSADNVVSVQVYLTDGATFE